MLSRNRFIIGLMTSAVMLLTTAGYSQAAPSVGNISGDITHGGTLTISGSGFGVKSPAAPMLWENFEWGSNGTPIDTSSKWVGEDSGDLEPVIDTSQSYGQGTRSNYCKMSEVGGSGTQEFRPVYHFFTESDKVYASYRARWSHQGGNPGIWGMWKTARIVGGGGLYNSGPYTGITYFPSSDPTGSPSFYYNEQTCDDCGFHGKWATANISANNWHRIDVYIAGSTPGVADGSLKYWIDEAKMNLGWDTVMTRNAGVTQGFDTFNSGHMWVNGQFGFEFYVWIDDLYLDNTQARVEVCDSSTWSSRSHCEIQIPTAWSDGSVSVTMNQGGFADLNTHYLYVIDSNGNVNSSGYPLCLLCPTEPAGPMVE